MGFYLAIAVSVQIVSVFDAKFDHWAVSCRLCVTYNVKMMMTLLTAASDINIITSD